jgi:hypothetical protein
MGTEGQGFVFTNFKRAVLEQELDLGTGGDTFYCILTTDSTPNRDLFYTYSDVWNTELTEATYDLGGKRIVNQDIAINTGSHLAAWDGDNTTFTSLTTTSKNIGSAMIMKQGDPYTLVAFWYVATAGNGGDYTLQWNANGIVTLT